MQRSSSAIAVASPAPGRLMMQCMLAFREYHVKAFVKLYMQSAALHKTFCYYYRYWMKKRISFGMMN